MKTGTKIALWLTGIAIVGVGGYFIWKSVKKSNEEKAEKELPKKPLSIPTLGQQIFNDPMINPFQDMLSLIAFQSWVIKSKNDKAILGNKGADGKWGENTARAWAKYGKEYDSLSKK